MVWACRVMNVERSIRKIYYASLNGRESWGCPREIRDEEVNQLLDLLCQELE